MTKRISSLLSSPESEPNHASHPHITRSVSTASQNNQTVWKNLGDGFNFDPLSDKPLNRKKINSSNNLLLETYEEDEIQKLKEVGQLSSVFLEVRKGIMDELNIDSSHNEKLEQEREHNKHQQHKKISKSTLNRAEKVKLMFNLYYLAMFQAQKVNNPLYEGVDGVYNPLQIIRNRKLRKKYHQYPQVSIKTLPSASTAFSHTKTPLLWEVDVAELTYDSSWRAQHWHELVNPKGELWFPDDRKKHRHHHRLHFRSSKEIKGDEDDGQARYDKLFDNNESNEDIENAVFQSSRSSSKSDLLDSTRLDRRKREVIMDKIRSKSPFRNKYTVTDEKLNKIELIDSDDNSKSFKILSDIDIEPIKPTIKITPETPTTDDEFEKSYLDSSLIKNNSNEYDDSFEYEQIKQINNHIKSLNYLNSMINFYNHDFEYKIDEYTNLTKFDGIDENINKIESNFQELKNNELPRYDKILKGKSEELREIQNELLNDYSTRIDQMLTSTDRTIGEVNTTLSLEIRKLKERFEKINSNKDINAQYDDFLNFTYWILENLIVLILWFIWIVFSILKVMKFSVFLVLSLLKWILS